jgi:hypothetical protein
VLSGTALAGQNSGNIFGHPAAKYWSQTVVAAASTVATSAVSIRNPQDRKQSNVEKFVTVQSESDWQIFGRLSR